MIDTAKTIGITGGARIVNYEPTMHLRWREIPLLKGYSELVLEQAWADKHTGDIQWREIPKA